MKFVKWLAVALTVFTLLACVAGCSEAPVESSAPKTTAPTTTTTTKADDGKVTYTITVKDEAGNPVKNAMIQLCSDNCIPTITDANGVATWKLAEDDYKASFLSKEVPATGYTYVDPSETEFYFEDGETEMTITLKAVAQ